MALHKPILIIETGETVPELKVQGQCFTDWFVSGLEILRSEVLAVDIVTEQSLPALKQFGGVIITGSPAYLTDFAPWNQLAVDAIRELVAENIPLLGVCYGHQLLAWAFGGEVGFHPEGREIGTVPISLSEQAVNDRLFAGLPAEFYVQASHQQSVLRLPSGAVRLAGNGFDYNHAFSLGDSAWGVQFHPEFDAATIRTYIKSRSDRIAAEGRRPEHLIEQVRETPHAVELLTRFLNIVRDRA